MLDKALSNFISQCNERNVSVVVVMKEGENSYRTVLANDSEDKDDRLSMIRDLMVTGNADDIIRDLIIHAQTHGHKSLYLRAMGISETPQKIEVRD